MARVLMGIPIRGLHDEVKWKTAECIKALKAYTKHAVSVQYFRGQQITQNSLDICLAMLNEDWDYLCYTGDDITFPPWALDVMIERDKDIIGAVCTFKSPPFWTTGMVEQDGDLKRFLVTRTHVANKSLIELDAVGSGFMVVKKSAIAAIHDLLYYKVYPAMPEEVRWMSPVPYFPVMFDPSMNMLTGSDYSFCRMAKKAGKRVFMDCSIICGHTWEYEFDVEDHWNWVEKYGFTKEHRLFPGQDVKRGEVPISDIYWGEEGPPLDITVTTRGSEYHTFNYILPVLGGRYEPIDTTDPNPPSKVGYLVGMFPENVAAWETYVKWMNRFERVLIHWVGSDSLWARENFTPAQWEYLRHPRFVHLAQSERQVADIVEWVGSVHVKNIPTAKQFPIAPLPPDFTVFVYYPKHRHDFHYGNVMKEVMEKMPDVTFRLCHLFGEKPDFEYPNMVWMGNLDGTAYPAALARSSCVLRLSQHEGDPLTVAEAAIMGRRFVTNFDMPHTVRVSEVPTADEVVQAITSLRKFTEPDEAISLAYRKLHSQRDYRDAIREVGQLFPEPVVMTSEMAKHPYDYQKYFQFRYAQGERGAGGPQPLGEEAKWTTEAVRDLISKYHCESVLDIGCGSMVRWDKLPVAESNYTGCDISEKALTFARQKFPKATFLQTDLTKEAIPSADAVISIDMMQHIRPQDFEAVLLKMAASARKLLVVKTSVGIDSGYYQFDHRFKWSSPIKGFAQVGILEVPGVSVSRVFVYVKTGSENGGEPGISKKRGRPRGRRTLQDALVSSGQAGGELAHRDPVIVNRLDQTGDPDSGA